MAADNWAGRSKGMRCERCMFWSRKFHEGDATDIGRCKRHAPVVGQGFPVTFDTDWCGDFKLTEEPVTGALALDPADIPEPSV